MAAKTRDCDFLFRCAASVSPVFGATVALCFWSVVPEFVGLEFSFFVCSLGAIFLFLWGCLCSLPVACFFSFSVAGRSRDSDFLFCCASSVSPVFGGAVALFFWSVVPEFAVLEFSFFVCSLGAIFLFLWGCLCSFLVACFFSFSACSAGWFCCRGATFSVESCSERLVHPRVRFAAMSEQIYLPTGCQGACFAPKGLQVPRGKSKKLKEKKK